MGRMFDTLRAMDAYTARTTRERTIADKRAELASLLERDAREQDKGGRDEWTLVLIHRLQWELRELGE